MILVCGEALVDLVPQEDGGLWRAVPGGGPANAAVALTRLGEEAALVCRLSGDVFGRQIRAHLVERGVDLEWAVAAREHATMAVVGLDADGAAEYSFYLQGTADWQWRPEELPEPSEDVRAIHTGSLAAALEPGAGVLREWARSHRDRVVIFHDVNARPAVGLDRAAFTEGAGRWMDVAHVVKVSDEDLAWLEPGRDPVTVAERLVVRHELDLLLLTRGGDGAVALSARWGDHVSVPGAPVSVRDTVGAGDTFGAAVLARLSDLGYLDRPGKLAALAPGTAGEVLEFAAGAAALACTTEGADPPDRAGVERFLRGTPGGR
ncbi:carbohydrate kinase [Nocardiopsis sp. EMB25]|uniref:carbohydrate kinase family protein n=1 Tax=Nocardiopsis sp. EMB25 TaxID=2835867 RepID=UPI002284CEE9|nr:carbohydrate kinase [Nocardiopsis sp. EMB25]MCY9783238.1 carbohydrate kinase [Nocardiopsis sp. EMB25]